MSRWMRAIVVTVSAAVLLYAGLGYVLGKTREDKSYGALTVYSEVLEHIQDDYVEDANLQSVTTGSLHGLLESLDPQSAYLSPKEFADYKKKIDFGEHNGTGAALAKRGAYILVLSVLPESPAEKAGLRSGDVLESIAGFTTRDMAIGQAEILLAGEPGTSVKVSVVRRGNVEPQDMEIVRAKPAPVKLVDETVAGDVAYLRIPAFDAGTASRIREKLADFAKQGRHKLILDLRDCSSGDFAEAISTAQLFLSTGTIATLRGQTVSAQTFTADPSKVEWRDPVTVLISNGTAGPAEILAGAIAGNHRGNTVGERTFGLASIQKTFTMEDGGGLILTVAEYFTPDGKSILEDGVEPTVPASDDTDDALLNPNYVPPAVPSASPENPVMKKAIELLNAPTAPQKAA